MPYKTEKDVSYAYFLPEKLDITGVIEPEIRYRGIYEVTLYKADLQISGSFNQPKLENITDEDILWNDALLAVELSKLNSINDKILLNLNDSSYEFGSSQAILGLFNGSIIAKIDGINTSGNISFSFDLKLNGSHSISFLPLGNETYVNINSEWPSPGFTGATLPIERDIYSGGFNAIWNIYSISRNYPQSFLEHDIDLDNINSSAFGINLFVPIDTYQNALRSLKYAILFLLLPFLTFFIFEIFSKLKVYPFQYFLIGISNCIFYLLLISISKHLFFNFAYIISSSSIICLITFYSRYLLGQWRKSIVIGFILFCLYLFLYIILQSEDYAL